jgi:AraC-like DNA-binding protein
VAKSNKIPAVAVQALFIGLSQLGLDPADQAQQFGLGSLVTLDPYQSIPNQTFMSLWAWAYEQSKDPMLASRLGLTLSPGAFGIIDHLGSRAKNAAEGLELVNAYFRLVATNMQITVSREKGEFVRVSNQPSEEGQRISEEWTLALLAGRFRRVIPDFALQKVVLPAAPQEFLGEYSQLWDAPVTQTGDHTEIELSPGVLDRPNPQADSSLLMTLRFAADRLQVETVEAVETIKTLMTSRMARVIQAGEPYLEAIARDLGLSNRSLQRRLSDQGISFRQLLDDYRRQRAIIALRDRGVDLASLAYSLGYREQSSFTRAFKRWTGITPSKALGDPSFRHRR